MPTEKYSVVPWENDNYAIVPGELWCRQGDPSLAKLICARMNQAYAQGREDQKKEAAPFTPYRVVDSGNGAYSVCCGSDTVIENLGFQQASRMVAEYNAGLGQPIESRNVQDEEVEFAGAAEIRDAAAELAKAKKKAYRLGQDAAMKDINLLLHREKQLSYDAGYSTGRKEGLAETDLRVIVNGLPSGDSDPVAAAYRRGRHDGMREQAVAELKAQLEAHDLGYQAGKRDRDKEREQEFTDDFAKARDIFESGQTGDKKSWWGPATQAIPPLPPAFAELLKKRPAPWKVVKGLPHGVMISGDDCVITTDMADSVVDLVNWAAALPQGEKAVEESEPIEPISRHAEDYSKLDITWENWLKLGKALNHPNYEDIGRLSRGMGIRFAAGGLKIKIVGEIPPTP